VFDSHNPHNGEDFMKILKEPLPISEQKWFELLNNPKVTYDIDKSILQALYESDNQENIASEIAKMVNCPNHGTVNLRVSEFSKRILKETGIQAPLFRDNGIPEWWHIPFWGWEAEDGNHYFWKLRPQLTAAIKNHPDLLQSVWIFQNNPEKSGLTIDLHVSEIEGDWSVRQHDKEIKKGDVVLFWITGENRGIYSIADILDKPKLRGVNPNEPWVTAKSSKKRKPEEFMVDYGGMRELEPQILESELIKIPGLSNLSIIHKKYRGTNFSVTKSEWDILSKEIDKRAFEKSEDMLDSESYNEGKARELIQTIYERDPRLRKKAIEIHGTTCVVCGFNFAKKYGTLGEGYIEIHHLIPHKEHKIKGPSDINPKTDLKPLCSNCHRMIHKPAKMLNIEELKKVIN
jgi:5-methylcytosine-specific restriction protein A